MQVYLYFQNNVALLDREHYVCRHMNLSLYLFFRQAFDCLTRTLVWHLYCCWTHKSKCLSNKLCETRTKHGVGPTQDLREDFAAQSLSLVFSVSHAEYLLEGLPEFRVEDGVDERVDAAVEVSQPRGQVEGDVARHPTVRVSAGGGWLRLFENTNLCFLC